MRGFPQGSEPRTRVREGRGLTPEGIARPGYGAIRPTAKRDFKQPWGDRTKVTDLRVLVRHALQEVDSAGESNQWSRGLDRPACHLRSLGDRVYRMAMKDQPEGLADCRRRSESAEISG